MKGLNVVGLLACGFAVGGVLRAAPRSVPTASRLGAVRLTISSNRTAVRDGQCVVISALADRVRQVADEPFAPAATAGLKQFAFIQNGGGEPTNSLSQIVSTAAGRPYQLRYAAAARSGEKSDRIEVLVANAVNGQRIAVQTPPITDAVFRFFTLNFTAASAATRIEFLNRSAVGAGLTVDVTAVTLRARSKSFYRSSATSGTGTVQSHLIHNGDFSVDAAAYARFPGYLGYPNPSAIAGWTAGVGSATVGVNGAATKVVRPLAGLKLRALLDGQPWCASETTGPSGVARFLLPLPQPGLARIQVALLARHTISEAYWIWLKRVANNQTVYFQRPFHLGGAARSARLFITCDNSFTAFLNGHLIGAGSSWQDVQHLRNLQKYLHPGTNVLSVKGFNVDGPAGLLARLTIHTAAGHQVIFTNSRWSCFATRPSGWPAAVAAGRAQSAQVETLVGRGAWDHSLQGWPGMAVLTAFPPSPARVLRSSNTVTVQVRRRRFHVMADPHHLIGMEYETWFGPGYAGWGQEEAEPILGRYSSLDPRVLRQQALWFNRMGINFVETDWTNNLTAPFPDAMARECIAATKALFHVYSGMRQHPKVVFLMGPEHNFWLNHTTPYTGPWFFQQLNYLYRHFINNPKYRRIYLHYHHKPLLLLYLNGPHFTHPPVVQDPRFTIRYVGAWLQLTKEERYGVWSWYDQKATPTYHQGRVEALTVTDGYPGVNAPGPGLNNWLAADAGGKAYGQTYRIQWRVADHYLPHFLFLCQWNEFEGGDQYSANLSNDMEPTLMGGVGAKRHGWGFFYTDLTRSEIQRYHRIIAARRGRHDRQGRK